MAGGGINNGEGGGKFLTGGLVGKIEFRIEASAQFKVLYINIWVMGKAGSLGNNTGMERVGEFGDRHRKTSVYYKFGNMLDALMGSMPKFLIDELNRDIDSRDIDI